MPSLPIKPKRKSYLPNLPRVQQSSKVSSKWYRKRAWVRTTQRFRKNNPMCEVFPDLPSEVTDHVIQIKLDKDNIPMLSSGAAWDERNFMAMSHKAHNIKRALERHGITIESVQTDNGRIPRNRNDIIELIRGRAKK